MGYQLELSPCSRYVYFRPLDVPTSAEEVSRRRTAIGDLARASNVKRVMLDFRERQLPANLPHYDAVMEARQALIQDEWRVAFLIAAMPPGISEMLVKGLAKLLVGMTLSAACFTDREQAEAWLVSEAPPPPMA